MWNFASNAIASIGLKKMSRETSQASFQCSDDEVSSEISREEGLECPICWESFNIVENVPYVLWCGHTLCQNCILGLQSAVVKLPAQKIKIPFFVSCPWCHFLSLRLFYNGSLKFPSKNYFILWMVESLNGDRTKLDSSSIFEDSNNNNQPVCSSECNLFVQSSGGLIRRLSHNNINEQLGSADNSNDGVHDDDDDEDDDDEDDVSIREEERNHFSLHKSLDFFINFWSKIPFAILLLLIVFFAVPGSVVILALYLIITVVFAVPASLVLYFTYPILNRIVREIRT